MSIEKSEGTSGWGETKSRANGYTKGEDFVDWDRSGARFGFARVSRGSDGRAQADAGQDIRLGNTSQQDLGQSSRGNDKQVKPGFTIYQPRGLAKGI